MLGARTGSRKVVIVEMRVTRRFEDALMAGDTMRNFRLGHRIES
jgi:hypothetical protein